MRLVYVVGVPGSGKSTTMTAALSWMQAPAEIHTKPIAHVVYGDVWHLGARRDVFGGTDALSMSVNPKAIEFLPVAAACDCRVLVGEGDRLANMKFLTAWPNTTVVYLDTPIALARERAAMRAVQLGRPEQSASWWKGRVTKIDNLIARLPYERLDGTLPTEVLGVELFQIIAAADRAPVR